MLGWVMATPWLVYLRVSTSKLSWLWFMLALQLGIGLQVAKIVTEPVPLIMAPMFSAPLAFGAGLTFLAFEALRRRLGDGWGLILFPAMMVVLEWAIWRFTEMGVWGSSVGTQLDDLRLLQIGSLFGLSGIAFLLGLVSALVAVLLTAEQPRRWTGAAIATGLLVLAAYGYGALRLDRVLPGPTATVAGVVSDVDLMSLRDKDALARETDALFERSQIAAARGAQLIVWNEGATYVAAEDEPNFLARAEALARAHSVDIVAAYATKRDGRVENKFAWITPKGLAESYLKHHPVPGEGSVRGRDPLQLHERSYARAGGAICYDFDFPALGRGYARLGAGLIALPSSDWRGIDPYHGLMARLRGIEGGYAVLRPVRGATSAVFDAFGRPRASLSHFEANDRILMAVVPTQRVPTLYAAIGDVLAWACLALILIGAGFGAMRRRSGEGARPTGGQTNSIR